MFEDTSASPDDPELRRVVLVSCCKTKAPIATVAADLYTSRVFRRSLAYARTLEPDDNIRIMSAAHGLVTLDREISPYDVTLRTMSPEDRRAWADGVAAALPELAVAELVVLAGEIYISGWRKRATAKITEPLSGLGNGPRFVRLGELLALPGDRAEHVNRRAMWGYYECGGCGAETAQWRAQCPCGSREIRRRDVPQLGSVL
jgi:hypothetical protein